VPSESKKVIYSEVLELGRFLRQKTLKWNLFSTRPPRILTRQWSRHNRSCLRKFLAKSCLGCTLCLGPTGEQLTSILSFMRASRNFHAIGLPKLWGDIDIGGSFSRFGKGLDITRAILDAGRRAGPLHLVRRLELTPEQWHPVLSELLNEIRSNPLRIVVNQMGESAWDAFWPLLRDTKLRSLKILCLREPRLPAGFRFPNAF